MAVRHLLAVVGNIASGKSTLVKALAAELHVAAEPERWYENPFLEMAQSDPTRYALAAESWFIVEAAAAQARLQAVDGGILERPLDEHLAVFVADRHGVGQLTGDDVAALRHVGAALRQTLRPIDLMIYLHAPADELLRRVRSRGRSFEQALDTTTLARIERRHLELLETSTSPVLSFDTTKVDVRTHTGVEEVLNRVRGKLR